MKKTLAVALLAAVAAPAIAADSGFYAGVNLGQSRSGNPYPGMTQTKSSDTAIGVLAGYQFTKNWGMEAFYTDDGKFATADNGGTISGKTRALGVVAAGTLPLSDAFSLYGKLGYAQTKANVTGAPTGGTAQDFSASRSAATYGLGGLYNVSPAVDIRFGWDRYAAAALDPTGATIVTGNFNVNVYSLGAVFKF